MRGFVKQRRQTQYRGQRRQQHGAEPIHRRIDDSRYQPAILGIAVNRGVLANRLLETNARNVYTLGDCAEVEGHVLYYVAPLMAGARALAKTLAGTPTEVVYPAMPVTIKTPACPIVVSPPPRDAEGSWDIQQDGRNVVARFLDPEGNLIGFALTGEGTSEKLALQKQLPPLMP